jgi:glycosyltransferase involved in cell wall biosynthesis
VPSAGIVVEINGGNKQYASTAYLEKIMSCVEQLKKMPAGGSIEVRERGSYDRQQLAQRMGAVDWVLVPSTWWEIFGLVVSEAWMFGRPVIASSIAALKEQVRDGVNGFTFPARDARALAELMASLVGSERKWNEVNSSIKQPWSNVEMFDAHRSVWEEFGRGDVAPVAGSLHQLSAIH